MIRDLSMMPYLIYRVYALQKLVKRMEKKQKKCCCLKEGSECPVEDLGVRQDDLLEEESCPDGQERCCHYSQSFFNNIANICEQTYNTIVDASTNNCTDHADQGYQCVPRINCDLDVGEIIVDGGPGIFTIRNDDLGELPLFEMDFENSKCRGASEVCCRHPDGLPPPSTEITTRPKVTKAKPDKKHPCGRRNKNGIRGGTSIGGLGTGGAQYGEWPWTCQVIQKANTGKSIPLGGATLIDEGIVLTYGTKVVGIDLNTIFVRCGDWDIRGDIEPLAVQEKGVYEVRIHPAYPRKPRRKDTTRAQFQDNIALLFVTEDFETGHNVDKVCLPSSVNSYNRTSCFATGWGKDKFDGEYQRIMKQVELNIVADNKCQDDLRDAIPSNNFILDQSFICAGGIPSAPADADTCTGDGGGPLMCPTDEYYQDYRGESIPIYEQAGIVNFGLGCGKVDVPAVYMDVAYELCFITWSARCVKGGSFAAFSGLGQDCGQDWGGDELLKIESEINEWEFQQEGLSPESRDWKNLQIKVDRHREVHKRWDEQVKGCQFDNSDSRG